MSFEGCQECGNEDKDFFHKLIDGRLVCELCGTLLSSEFKENDPLEEKAI